MIRQIETDTIYLDHAATTPVDPDVLRVMAPWFTQQFGNPSSIYQLGQQSRAALDTARAQCAAVLGCQPAKSSHQRRNREQQPRAGRSSGRARTQSRRPAPHIITTAVEHPRCCPRPNGWPRSDSG